MRDCGVDSHPQRGGKVIRFDRSRLAAYQSCPRKRYWEYEHLGTGISPKAHSVPLLTGIALHEVMAKVASGFGVEDALAEALAAHGEAIAERGLDIDGNADVIMVVTEQRAIIEGLARAWVRARKPLFDAEYEVVLLPDVEPQGGPPNQQGPYIEREDIATLAPGVELMVRADLVVRRRLDGALGIIDFKSFGYVPSDWEAVWDHSTPRLSQVLGVEARMGEKVEFVCVEGMYKGYKISKGKEKGLLQSPLICGYMNDDKDKFEWDSELASGCANCGHRAHKGKGCTEQFCQCRNHSYWNKFRVWNEMGVAEWVEKCLPEAACAAQFVTTTPLVRDQGRLDSWVRQAVSIETGVARDRDTVNQFKFGSGEWVAALDQCFPQHFGHCHAFNGSPCPFVKVCFESMPDQEPLETGSYVARRPHHSTEVEE